MSWAPTPAQVGAAVQAELAAAGITRSQAAAAVGISLSTLRRRLSGQVPLRIDELEVLGGLVGMTPAGIIEAADPVRAAIIAQARADVAKAPPLEPWQVDRLSVLLTPGLTGHTRESGRA